MTNAADLFMGLDPYVSSEPRTRLARFLQKRYPARDGYSVKRLSSTLKCTPKTAENILAGHWPSSRHWQRIAACFGRDVLDAVFGPDIDATVARLKQEAAELEQQLATKRALRLQAEGLDARSRELVEADEAAVAVNDPPKVRRVK